MLVAGARKASRKNRTQGEIDTDGKYSDEDTGTEKEYAGNQSADAPGSSVSVGVLCEVTELIPVIEKLASAGFATFLVVIIIAGRYRIWLWSWTFDEMLKAKNEQIDYERREKEYWRSAAFQNKDLADRSVVVASKVVEAR